MASDLLRAFLNRLSHPINLTKAIDRPGNCAPFQFLCNNRLANSIALYWLRVNPWEINRREAKVSKPIAISITTPKVDANEKSALRSQ